MINGASMFSNVGIGELFLKECGINIVLANEIEKNRASLYKYVYNDCEVIVDDINDCYDEFVQKAKSKKCTFLIATPPCQGMSVAGKRDKDDERNQLIIPVLNAINDIDPDYVLIENVPQILNLKISYKGQYDTVEKVIESVFSNKYKINKNKLVNAQSYGVPQNRKRAIILLSKKEKWDLPTPSNNLITVRETIGSLPSVEAVVEGNLNYFSGNDKKIEECIKVNKWHFPKNHAQRHVEVMQHTPTGHSAFENEIYYPKKTNGEKVRGYNTTYKRMEWDKPAPTITMANGVISSQCNVHPGRIRSDGTYSDARALTIYEIMKLFTIPDDWNIPENINENFIRQVIGEGVPPLLIKKIVQNIGGLNNE